MTLQAIGCFAFIDWLKSICGPLMHACIGDAFIRDHTDENVRSENEEKVLDSE